VKQSEQSTAISDLVSPLVNLENVALLRVHMTRSARAHNYVCPNSVTLEHKSIHSHLLVPSDAEVLYKFWHSRNGGRCRKEPAITKRTLDHISRRGAIDEELWFPKNLGDSLDIRGVRFIGFLRVQTVQTLLSVFFEVEFDVTTEPSPELDGRTINR
jgi:hypothetical protein